MHRAQRRNSRTPGLSLHLCPGGHQRVNQEDGGVRPGIPPYPSHGLGPVAQYMSLARGEDIFARLASYSSPALGRAAYAQQHFPPAHKWNQLHYLCGDINTSIIQTQLGRTILVQWDETSPRPYTRSNLIQGTRGALADFPPRMAGEFTRPFLTRCEAEPPPPELTYHSCEERYYGWTRGKEELAPLYEQYEHPLYRRLGEFAATQHRWASCAEAFFSATHSPQALYPHIPRSSHWQGDVNRKIRKALIFFLLCSGLRVVCFESLVFRRNCNFSSFFIYQHFTKMTMYIALPMRYTRSVSRREGFLASSLLHTNIHYIHEKVFYSHTSVCSRSSCSQRSGGIPPSAALWRSGAPEGDGERTVLMGFYRKNYTPAFTRLLDMKFLDAISILPLRLLNIRKRFSTLGSPKRTRSYPLVWQLFIIRKLFPHPNSIDMVANLPQPEQKQVAERLFTSLEFLETAAQYSPSQRVFIAEAIFPHGNSVTIIEQLPMVDRIACTERLPMSERLRLIERLSMPQRVEATERLPMHERVAAIEKLPMPQRMEATERLPMHERVAAIEKLPNEQRAVAINTIPNPEQRVLIARRLLPQQQFRNVFHSLAYGGKLLNMPDEQYLELFYYARTGKTLNLQEPKSYNEKLQWLKLYDRNPIYPKLVDKYEVKDYVAARIGSEHIIPTLGVWEHFDDIDFDALPDQFVLKTTHDCGGIYVCSDKNLLDTEEARNVITSHLEKNYYYIAREWVYKDIKPRIIAEKFMQDGNAGGLKDYKFFCYEGVVKTCLVVSDRFKKDEEIKFDMFDADFNHLPLRMSHAPNDDKPIVKPNTFEEMKRLATILSKDFLHVRVDLYDISGCIYFGELTFCPGAGQRHHDPEEWDYKFGEWLQLPTQKV